MRPARRVEGFTGDWTATGVRLTRARLRQAILFVALSDVRDGHDFVGAALDKGAAAAMVSP